MTRRIGDCIDHTVDSVRYYALCKDCVRRSEFSGLGEAPNGGVDVLGPGAPRLGQRAQPLQDARHAVAAKVCLVAHGRGQVARSRAEFLGETAQMLGVGLGHNLQTPYGFLDGPRTGETGPP